MEGGLLAACVIGAILIVGAGLVFSAIRVVPQFQRLVVFRFGNCIGQKGPGLVLLYPFGIDRATTVDLREEVREVPHQTNITKDNAPIGIDFLIYWQVVDSVKSVLEVNNFMPGGIALSQTTLRAVIGEMFECLLRHGLDRLIVINGHGGNVTAIHDEAQKVYRAKGVLIPSLYLWRMAYALLPAIRGREEAAKVAGHGADPLTSVAMHLFPRLLRPDLIAGPVPCQVLGLPVSTFAAVRFRGIEVGVPVELDELAPNGVMNADPRLCSAEVGEKIVAELVSIGADFVAHYAAQRG